MTQMVRSILLSRTAIAASLLAAFGSVCAQGSEVEASVSAGVGVSTGDRSDRSWFGQYNGMRTNDLHGLLGVEYDRRNAQTGSSVRFLGTDLGLDTRELIFQWKRQGDWRFSADYNEMVRYDPYTLNTGLIGAGSTTPQVVRLGSAGTGFDLDLKTRRKGLGIELAKWISPVLELDVNLKTEKKEGARRFGVGVTCPPVVVANPDCGPTTAINAGWALLMLPEPIDANHHQAEARLSYAGERLRLSVGYYGSFYRNDHGSLNPVIPDTLNNPLGAPLPLYTGLRSLLALPVALAPDNEAHQFDVTGNYSFTPTTRANFKMAFTRATQNQDFAGSGLSGGPAGFTDLDGKGETTLAQVGITSRPIARLTLSAEGRYEDRNDKTALAPYFDNGTTVSTNRQYDRTKVRGKLQATYQFTRELQGTVGADYESIDRGSFTSTAKLPGVSAWREETEETGVRIELRRRMTETFSGAISLQRSDRDGSSWQQPNSTVGVTTVTDPGLVFDGTSIFIATLADRRRDKGKLSATWQATDELMLQFGAEFGRDRFSTPNGEQGLRRTKMYLYSLDATYTLSEEWGLTGYASRGRQRLNQAKPAGYILSFADTSTSLGVGVSGKPSERLSVGADLAYINDRNDYTQALDASANPGSAVLLAATGGLPDILFRRTELKLFGKYALNERSAVRLDAIYQHAKFNDWAYGYAGVPFTYSDNTTVALKQSQDAGFLGVTYIYSWQ